MVNHFGPNALKILEDRYLLRGKNGKVKETPAQMLRRVAKAVAAPESKWGGDSKKMEDVFYEMMASLEFLPNSTALMNAGEGGQLSACHVIPVGDSTQEIFDAMKSMALVHQYGGGTGFSFSRLRPEGEPAGSTGKAPGPVATMKMFNSATEASPAGRRRGASMGVLRVDHPDILKFIAAKADMKELNSFNISVAITDEFMAAVREKSGYVITNPHTGKTAGRESARKVFSEIVNNAWKTGDPGVIFIDEINRKSLIPGNVETTDTCGEAVLLAWESCCLGSINLTKMLSGKAVDWEKLKTTARNAVRFLDNMTEANVYPLEQMALVSRANRKIGLGVMGFADMLIMLNIPYDSGEALRLAGKLMSLIQSEARNTSEELGKERGSFPNFSKSSLAGKYSHMRNATCIAIAPTGTISLLTGCSCGIEPLFAISFKRNVLGGLLETNHLFEVAAKKAGFYSKGLMERVTEAGSVRRACSIPQYISKVFVTAQDISPEWHIKMQAEFQKYTDQAVSKTVNLPNNATPKDVERAFLLAYEMKCKGVTVYRRGSREDEVLVIQSQKDRAMKAHTKE